MEEVTIPAGAVAKKIRNVFLDHSVVPAGEIAKAPTQFVTEYQLVSTLCHPNVVQFLGVCFVATGPRSGLVLTSLHDLLVLDPQSQHAPDTPAPLSFFTLGLKCRVLHDVASGLDYLHKQTPPIIHCDLSARNILLCSGLLAKIAVVGEARSVHIRMKVAATMTEEAYVYMPPEALAPSVSSTQESNKGTSMDIFSFGVVTIFTISETFPYKLLEPNYLEDESKHLAARTELQRRGNYMQSVNAKLHACGQFREDHPLIQLIHQCLDNSPHKRPNIHEVLHLLEEARAGIRDEERERNKEELVRALQNQPRNQVRKLIFAE